MTDRPPPFSALRAVEAATRHRSFTWAAKELHITHSAVSQSIRRLEADLGTTLFERRGGAMEPSEAAMRLAESYSGAARSLERTLREITGVSDEGALNIALPADLGRLWFGAKLARLAEAMPDLHINVRTGEAAPGERDEDVVVELGDATDRETDAMGPELRAFPACSPDFLRTRELTRPAQVLRAPLIASSTGDWDRWASAFDARASACAYAFDDPAMALDAASRGAGVALVNVFVAEAYLEGGRLVALPLEAPTGQHLLASTRSEPTKAGLVDRFLMWLRLEVARTLALQAGRASKAAKR